MKRHAPRFEPSRPSEDLTARAKKYADAFEIFCAPLSAAEREAFRQELLSRLSAIAPQQPSILMGTVINLFDRQKQWRVSELKEELKNEGIKVESKPLYNVLGHLARRGRIRKIDYGRYALVDYGAAIETADELGVD